MGRPQFAQAGTKGGGDVVATTNRPEVKHISQTNTASVASGASENIEIYAPTGSVYQTQSMRLYVPADGTATSGSHYFVIKSIDNVMALGRGGSVYNSRVYYNFANWKTADNAQEPSDGAAQQAIVDNLWATENSPIRIKYGNSTDAAQDNSREYQFVVREDSY